jgi:hypothetical protein
VEADLDTLDVVVIAGEALGVVAVADVTIGVLWATEAADDDFDALEAPEATGVADDAPVARGAVDDDVGLLEATGDAGVATALLEAIGLLAAVRTTEVDNGLLGMIGATDAAVELLKATETATDADELLGTRGAADIPVEVLVTTKMADEAFDALEETGVTDIAIGLLEETGEEEGTIGLLGITATTDDNIELLEATGTITDAIGLLETAGTADVAVKLLEITRTVDKADELLKLIGVVTGADELLAITGTVEIVVIILEATDAAEEAIELLGTNGRVTDVERLFEAMEAAGVAIGLLGMIGVADDDTAETGAADDDNKLLGTIGAIDIPIVLLDTTTTLEDGKIELDPGTIWLTEAGWDGVIVEILWGTIEVAVVTVTTIALDVVGAAEETAWLDELTITVTVFRGKPLEDEIIEGIALDAEFAMLGSVTLDTEVETIGLDALLAGAWEVADNVEGLDPGAMLVAPTTTAILVVGVDKTMGAELEMLPATVTMLEDDTTWLVGLLLTWAADVARLELVKALWTDELGTTIAVLLTVDGRRIVGDLRLLLIEVATLATVLLNTDEVVWLGTLLDWARTGDAPPRPVVSGIAWVVVTALDTTWDVDRTTVIPELPTIEPTTVVAGFAALAETWVEATEPAPTSATLLPPAVWITCTLVSPTPTLTI